MDGPFAAAGDLVAALDAASLALQRPGDTATPRHKCWEQWDFPRAIVLVKLRHKPIYNPNAIRPSSTNADFLESAFVTGPKIMPNWIFTGDRGRFFTNRELSWLGFNWAVCWKRAKNPRVLPLAWKTALPLFLSTLGGQSGMNSILPCAFPWLCASWHRRAKHHARPATGAWTRAQKQSWC